MFVGGSIICNTDSEEEDSESGSMPLESLLRACSNSTGVKYYYQSYWESSSSASEIWPELRCTDSCPTEL